MKTTVKTTRMLLAVAAGAVCLLVAAGSAAAAHDATQATADCWRQVVNDWEDNGRIDNVYAPPCYTQAIQHLSSYPDLQGYSSVIDDIQRALYAVLHEEGRGGVASADTTSSSDSKSHHGDAIFGGSGGGGGGGGPINWLSNHLAPGNAQSVPLPLLVLGGLALLLLVAAAATWFARRLQTRRVTPAPAPAPASQPRRR